MLHTFTPQASIDHVPLIQCQTRSASRDPTASLFEIGDLSPHHSIPFQKLTPWTVGEMWGHYCVYLRVASLIHGCVYRTCTRYESVDATLNMNTEGDALSHTTK
jgi:hypothetical protein